MATITDSLNPPPAPAPEIVSEPPPVPTDDCAVTNSYSPALFRLVNPWPVKPLP